MCWAWHLNTNGRVEEGRTAEIGTAPAFRVSQHNQREWAESKLTLVISTQEHAKNNHLTLFWMFSVMGHGLNLLGFFHSHPAGLARSTTSSRSLKTVPVSSEELWALLNCVCTQNCKIVTNYRRDKWPTTVTSTMEVARCPKDYTDIDTHDGGVSQRNVLPC